MAVFSFRAFLFVIHEGNLILGRYSPWHFKRFGETRSRTKRDLKGFGNPQQAALKLRMDVLALLAQFIGNSR